MIKNSFLWMILVPIVLSSCKLETSDSVKQDKIWSAYSIEYNKNTDNTSVSASFKFSYDLGTNLQLTSPATITFNDKEMSFSSFLGMGSYSNSYSGYMNNGTFKYTDLDGKEFVNSVSNLNPIKIPKIRKIKKSSDLVIVWEGTALMKGEDVSVSIRSDKDTIQTSITASVNSVGAKSIMIPAAELEKLVTGNEGTISMERKYQSEKIDGTSVGGKIECTYIAKTITGITIKE